MRTAWIGTGWKMNFVRAEAEAYLRTLATGLAATPPGAIQVFVVPPFTVLHRACELARGLPLHVGAQNMHWEASGAFTGEISPAMVKDTGADMVELGHSERRAMFGETDAAVNRKVHAALAQGLVPLVCVGETGEEKALSGAKETVVRQVKMALHGVPAARAGEVVLAYEPVWAIGAGGTPAEPSYASAVHAAIRGGVADLLGSAAADRVPVLYGGSVDLANAPGLLASPGVDGLFVGRTAWNPSNLLELVRMALAARR
jgi:L-erythrulose 1-phosphate isomerase